MRGDPRLHQRPRTRESLAPCPGAGRSGAGGAVALPTWCRHGAPAAHAPRLLPSPTKGNRAPCGGRPAEGTSGDRASRHARVRTARGSARSQASWAGPRCSTRPPDEEFAPSANGQHAGRRKPTEPRGFRRARLPVGLLACALGCPGTVAVGGNWLGLVDDFRTFKMEVASLNLNEFIAA